MLPHAHRRRSRPREAPHAAPRREPYLLRGTDLAVVAHEHATIIDAKHLDFAELDATQVECGNQSVRDWSGEGIYLHLQPTTLYTFARHPDRYPTTPP
jgi:hypothetical protein